MTNPEQRFGKKGEEGFAEILRRSIQQGLESVVGHQTAMAVEFYIDSSLAAKDIVLYTRALEKMFGDSSKQIEESCAQILYSNLKLEFQWNENYRLSDYVRAAQRN